MPTTRRSADDADEQWLEHFLNESDRGCVLIAHAILEELLGECLLEHFRHHSNATPVMKEILKSGMGAPLGSFSSRLKLAYVLGLIDDSIYAMLRRLNALRVDFAHYKTPAMFLTRKQVESFAHEFTERHERCFECMRQVWEPVLVDKKHSEERRAFMYTAILLINEFKTPSCKGQ